MKNLKQLCYLQSQMTVKNHQILVDAAGLDAAKLKTITLNLEQFLEARARTASS